MDVTIIRSFCGPEYPATINAIPIVNAAMYNACMGQTGEKSQVSPNLRAFVLLALVDIQPITVAVINVNYIDRNDNYIDRRSWG
jgi:hypothetical protein